MNWDSDEVDQHGILKNMLTNLDTTRYGGDYGAMFPHNSKLSYFKPNNVYEDALVSCPLFKQNNWHAVLGITSTDEPNKVIMGSNTFYWETSAIKYQNTRHRIFDRMIYNYHRMRNYPKERHTVIKEESLLLANTFTGVNSGHDLSIILDVVAYYRAHATTIQKIVILKAVHWYPNNLLLLKLLLGPKGCEKLFEMDWNKVYRFNKIHIFKTQMINISHHSSLCEELRQAVLQKSKHHKAGARVVLLKTHRDKNVVTFTNQLICEGLLQRLEKAGWLILNPEKCDIYQLCATLLQAETIVFSHGSILYTHMIFFNPTATLKWVAVGNEKLSQAYAYVSARRPERIGIPSRDLDNNLTQSNQLFERLNVVAARVVAPAAAPTRARAYVTTPTPPTRMTTIRKITPVAPTVTPTQIGAHNPLGEPGMQTNSGLLQEHFFVRAILEAAKGISFIAGVDHRNATCMVELIMPAPKLRIRKTYTILFPMKRFELIKELWTAPTTTTRIYKYYFRGLINGGSSKKQWVRQYQKSGNYIEHNLRGRGKDKYVFDTEYFRLMCQSEFVLAPIDVYPWSYRFLEAIMCRCIPILNVGDDDILSNGFHFYRTNENHVWREDWVEANLQRLLKIHTLSDPNHEFNKIIASAF